MIFARIAHEYGDQWQLLVARINLDANTVERTFFEDAIETTDPDPTATADARLAAAGWHRTAEWERLGHYIARVEREQRSIPASLIDPPGR